MPKRIIEITIPVGDETLVLGYINAHQDDSDSAIEEKVANWLNSAIEWEEVNK